MDAPQSGGTKLRRRGAAAAPPSPAPPADSAPSSAAAPRPPPPPPPPPPSYAEYVQQVSSEVTLLFAIHHLLVAAIASAANPALRPADVLPLKASAVLVVAVHLAPWTASRVLATAKSLTIPVSVAGLLVETLVRADRAAAAAAAAGEAAPSAASWWPPPPLVAALAWRTPPSWGAVRPAAVVGWVAAVAGAALLAWTVALFYTVGDGTLSPESATSPRRLVTAGPFRVSRNPMIAGAVALVAGQAGVRDSARTALYAIAFCSFMHVQIVAVEEPALAARFGDEYAAYVQSTPRWVPALWRRREASP